jgi:hypothetical protein
MPDPETIFTILIFLATIFGILAIAAIVSDFIIEPLLKSKDEDNS